MTAQEYFDTYHDQSLLYAPSKAREGLRGQCVQAVCYYVAGNGKPVIWNDAKYWFTTGLFPDQYQRIENTPSAVPLPGDIIVWSGDLPGSGGAGHIAVVLSASMNSFISIDQNWGGKTVHKVSHNYSYVLGWLRLTNVAAPAQKGDKPMTPDEEKVAYEIVLERKPEGGASSRTGIQFILDARPELDAKRKAAGDTFQQMQVTINQQNDAITKALSDDQADKDALKDALSKVADLNSQLTNQHDVISDIQAPANSTMSADDAKAGLITKIIAAVMRKFNKK